MFETGGKWWPRVARLYIVALIFAQSTMAGMMMLKQGLYIFVLVHAYIFLRSKLYQQPGQKCIYYLVYL